MESTPKPPKLPVPQEIEPTPPPAFDIPEAATAPDKGAVGMEGWKSTFRYKVLFSWTVVAWVIAALIGVGGLLMTLNEFTASKVVVWVCATILSVKLVEFVVKSHDPLWQNAIFLFLTCSVLAILALGSIKWIDKKEAQAPRSSLFASMVIDGIDDSNTYFHFLFECDGPEAVRILHISYHTDSMASYDGDALPSRLIPPNNKLAWNSLMVERRSQAFFYTLVVVYETDIAGAPKTFTTRFEFPIEPLKLVANSTIYPSYREESAGDIMGGDKDMIRATINALRHPTGTIVFSYPETRPDGLPNDLIISAGGDRHLLIDPTNRLIDFTMVSGRRVYNLQQPLPVSEGHQTMICATWDDIGNVHLYVNGKE
jgi:hypothetical protein